MIAEVLYEVLEFLKNNGYLYDVDVLKEDKEDNKEDNVFHVYITKHVKTLFNRMYNNGHLYDFFVSVNKDGEIWLTYNENNLPVPFKSLPNGIINKSSDVLTKNYYTKPYRDILGKGKLRRIRYPYGNKSYGNDMLHL